ncbi:hypothetical protein B0H13DRAFT_2001409 [Mycena leptocephala]|nr:hypothetical protein B0H13DRAFT_2001409 [Mycena leptocephala]
MFTLRLSRSLSVAKHGRWRLFSDVSLPIPPKSKGWPTPWITETDATDYLFPLYLQGCAHGWPACRFTFPSCPPAAAFIRDILTLTETENHHPCWLKLTNSINNSAVNICTTTHSALRPVWDPSDTPDSRALEGITLRDLRFAALISSLPSNTYHPSAEIGPSRTRPTWEDLCATLRHWSTRTPPSNRSSELMQEPADDVPKPEIGHSKKKPPMCVACGGPHSTDTCRVRKDFTPPPCSTCGGLHWRVDCPIRGEARRSFNRLKKKPYASSELPPEPCPNCGGAHWKVDCRVPQAPPQLLEGLRLRVPEPSVENIPDKVDK